MSSHLKHRKAKNLRIAMGILKDSGGIAISPPTASILRTSVVPALPELMMNNGLQLNELTWSASGYRLNLLTKCNPASMSRFSQVGI
jgi:hypothetical protein